MIDLQNCEHSLSDALKENNLAQSIALPSSLITDKTPDNAIDFDEKPIVANTKTFEQLLTEKLMINDETITPKISADQGLFVHYNTFTRKYLFLRKGLF